MHVLQLQAMLTLLPINLKQYTGLWILENPGSFFIWQNRIWQRRAIYSNIEYSLTKNGKWVLKALNPGSAIIALKKDKSGHKHEKHHCQHTITVVAKKDSGKANSAQTEKPASKDKNSSKKRENRKANKTESTQAAQ